MKYVSSQEQVSEVVRSVQRSAWAAVDTEADSLHHYIEKLCLLQITTPDDDFVIDPLASADLQPLASALESKSLILHGADFDIRILKRFYAFTPREIFDTMIASQLLGYDKQGLADLAKKHCDVSLPKAGQKADWSRRPLTQELLVYAANDTHYLPVIKARLEAELEEKGRLSWLSQNCARLLKALNNPKAEKKDREHAWQIKGSRLLGGPALTLLKEFWNWREEEAKRRDRPSFKVLNSEYLIDMAQWVEKHPGADIREWGAAPRNVKKEHAEAINRIIAGVAHVPQAVFVKHDRPRPDKKWGEKESKKLGALKELRQKRATELGLVPGNLATNTALEAVVEAAPQRPEDLEKLDSLLPWQIEALGRELLDISRP